MFGSSILGALSQQLKANPLGFLADRLRENPHGLLADRMRENPHGVAAGEMGGAGLAEQLYGQEETEREPSRWVSAAQALGAGLQDMQAASTGRQGGNLERFNQAQDRMRSAREESRRRQLRFQHLRDTVPASDRQFWQAYALGGEEAALSALQSRHNQENETHTLSPGEQLFRGGEMIAENSRRSGQEPAIVGSLRAANIDPASDEGRRLITQHYAQNMEPGMADIASRLTQKVLNGEQLTEQEDAAWQRILDYRRQPDPFASFMFGNGSGSNNDPLGWNDQ